jgi:hypothetical protein
LVSFLVPGFASARVPETGAGTGPAQVVFLALGFERAFREVDCCLSMWRLSGDSRSFGIGPALR